MALMPSYGWVQDTSNLGSIRDTLELVPDVGISHIVLRSAIRDQKRRQRTLTKRWDYVARCEIRGIQALGFVSLDRALQGYRLTELGYALKQALRNPLPHGRMRGRDRILTNEEKRLFGRGILTNPPAIRVLRLLAKAKREGKALTKYDVGKLLGFVGDSGFTHLEAEWVIANGYSPNDKEGDSDKYARTIIRWLQQVGWAQETPEKKAIEAGGRRKELSQYEVTGVGARILETSARKIVKIIPGEMLASSAKSNPLYPEIRQRRSLILSSLSSRQPVQLNTILNDVRTQLKGATEELVRLDLKNLEYIGLSIHEQHDVFLLRDRVELDPSPLRREREKPTASAAEDQQKVAELCASFPRVLPRIIDGLYRYSKSAHYHNEFESVVREYFSMMKYDAQPLGQGRGRVSDCIAKYKDHLYPDSYAVIIDAKATASPYRFPVSDLRKMKEYVNSHGPTLLKEGLSKHAFLFISHEFGPSLKHAIREIRNETHVDGSALRVEEAIYLAEKVSSSGITLKRMYALYIINGLITKECIDSI